jgi:hypothetical protein
MDTALFDVTNLHRKLTCSKKSDPFDHWVIPDFFPEQVARSLENDFPEYDDSRWFTYENPIENKKALNNWAYFPIQTYRVMAELCSSEFVNLLSSQVGTPLFPDPGLHGGGWHIHGRGGNLNPHLDYSIHPKLKLQRRLNIIVYLSSGIRPEHGGHLGFWQNDAETHSPGKLIEEYAPSFNTAVIFDTTKNSWHGMSRPVELPVGIYRKSLAVYYLCAPQEGASPRERALFAPRESQKHDPDIAELIRRRADSNEHKGVYRVKKPAK